MLPASMQAKRMINQSKLILGGMNEKTKKKPPHNAREFTPPKSKS